MKDPAVLFYTQDFITGTLLMSYEQKGKYITLLCLQQQNGRLSEKDLLKVCGEKDDDIWAKFTIHDDGFYYNGRMLLESEKRNKYCQSRRDVRQTYVKRMENANENEIGNKKEEKEIVFKSEVFEFSEKYSEVMLNKFCDYWTEKSKGGKMRYEFEKTFEISKRLNTWASRDKEFTKTNRLPDTLTYDEIIKLAEKDPGIMKKYKSILRYGERKAIFELIKT
jgi:hypothetical protein